MNRVLEAHSKQPNRVMPTQKERAELLRKNKEMQDSRSTKSPEARQAKSLEKNRVGSEVKGKGAERGRERRSQGRS